MFFRAMLFLVLSAAGAMAEPKIIAPEVAETAQQVTVRLEGLETDIAYWVTLIPKNAELGTWKEFVYIQNATTAEVTLTAPAPGAYELRLHDKVKPYPLYARIPFTVTELSARSLSMTLERPPAADKPTVVNLSGLDRGREYWITLIPADAEIGTWAEFKYIKRKDKRQVRFKPVPGGAYELRLHDRAEGYPLYLKQAVTMPGRPATAGSQGQVAATGSAKQAPEYKGPCPRMQPGDGASVAACLRHMKTTSMAYVFSNVTSTCGNMQFQLTLAQENKEGTRQNLRGVDTDRTVEIDCKTLAQQVKTVFDYTPPWAGCTDHPSTVGPKEHIACIEGTPMSAPPRHAVRWVGAAIPTDCRGLIARLQSSYSAVFPEFRKYPNVVAAFGTMETCPDYQPYLEANVARREQMRQKMAEAEAQKRMAAVQRAEASRAMQQAMDTGLDQMHRDSVANLMAKKHPADAIEGKTIRWALVKLLHRLEKEHSAPGLALLHTTNGLMQRTGRGEFQLVSYNSVASAKVLDCGRITSRGVRCEVDATFVRSAAAPGNAGNNFLVGTFGGGKKAAVLTLDLRHNGDQWELATVSDALLDLVFPDTGQAAKTRNKGFSPEECLWLRSMGSAGWC